MFQNGGQLLRTDRTAVNSWWQKSLKLPKGAEDVRGGGVVGAAM